MFCPKCGNQQTDDAKFCRSCGGILTASHNTPMKVFCPKCGAQIDSIATLCPYCGQPLKGGAAVRHETSWAWWLLPVFFTWLGGIIAWEAVKGRDKVKARNMLILGIVLFVVWIVFWFLVGACSDPYYYE